MDTSSFAMTACRFPSTNVPGRRNLFEYSKGSSPLHLQVLLSHQRLLLGTMLFRSVLLSSTFSALPSKTINTISKMVKIGITSQQKSQPTFLQPSQQSAERALGLQLPPANMLVLSHDEVYSHTFWSDQKAIAIQVDVLKPVNLDKIEPENPECEICRESFDPSSDHRKSSRKANFSSARL